MPDPFRMTLKTFTKKKETGSFFRKEIICTRVKQDGLNRAARERPSGEHDKYFLRDVIMLSALLSTGL